MTLQTSTLRQTSELHSARPYGGRYVSFFLLFLSGTLVTSMIAAAAAKMDNDDDISRMAGGNTLMVTNRSGRPTFIAFSPAGYWKAVSADGAARTEGNWRAHQGQLCVRQTSDVPNGATAKEHCLTLTSKAFGIDWQANDPVIGAVTYRWLKGEVVGQPQPP